MRREPNKQTIKNQGESARPYPTLQHLIPYERFRFTVKVQSLTVLPPYKGGVFRGAFGNTFRRVVCALPRSDCTNCLVNRQCLYIAFFEPPPPRDYPDAARFKPASPPYVLNPPLTNRQAFHPNEVLDFDLVLVGRAIEALPYFVYTFMEMGKRGIGREHGRYALESVHLLRDGSESLVYDGSAQTINAYPPKGERASWPDEALTNSVTLEFLTPLRLKEKGRLVTQLTFPLFFERLAQRISLLAAFYGSGNTLPDLSALTDLAQEIDTSSDELHWYEWERYSGRQKAAIKLGGLKGRITFTGDLGPFMPFLRLGEEVNVGQGTSFGLGHYHLGL